MNQSWCSGDVLGLESRSWGLVQSRRWKTHHHTWKQANEAGGKVKVNGILLQPSETNALTKRQWSWIKCHKGKEWDLPVGQSNLEIINDFNKTVSVKNSWMTVHFPNLCYISRKGFTRKGKIKRELKIEVRELFQGILWQKIKRRGSLEVGLRERW